jgi:integrase/recombinase XerC
MIRERFFNYLTTEKRYSVNTITAYLTDIDQFSAFIQSEYQMTELTQVTHQMVRSWIVFIMSNGNSARTINRKLSALKTFFRFLRKEGVISDNPMQRILSPKTGKKLPEFVSQEQMDLLFDEIAFDQGFKGTLDRLILEILYFTGMRLSELIQLKDSDTDLYQCQFKVLGKGNKERIVPFGKELGESISQYFRTRKSVVKKQGLTGFLLITDRGYKLNKQYVYRMVNGYLGKVSTLKKKSPHILRHTFATHMLNNGADLNSIKDILGHASLAATQVYTHNSIEKLKNVYNQAHPRA